MKDIECLGDSLARLRAFPTSARREAGFQLDRVQRGNDPDDWKPMNTIGVGVREIRISEAIYVLHAFMKKTRTTAQRDIDLARARVKMLKSGS